MTHSSLLGDLIDLSDVLEADQAIDLEQRKQRDRKIGRKLQSYRNKPAAQMRAWLHAINHSATTEKGAQGIRVYHLLCLVLIIAGLLTGWALASAVLYYDGKQPINIVNALVVLVIPQILLLFLWLLAALPWRLPLLGGIRTSFALLNPGRLAGQLAGLFSGSDGRGLDLLWNPDNAATLTPSARWLFSFWSQLFAFSFNIGILMSAFFLVSSSDLAFVWSSTLNISSGAFHHFLSILSAPWVGFLPDAVPGAELVAKSRYYRLEEGSLAGAREIPQLAIELGQWWSFLIAAVSFYGLLPRLLTLVISWVRFRYHLRKALCNLPGSPELLARMNSPLVSTHAAEPEPALKMKPGRVAGSFEVKDYALRSPIIDWAGTCHDVKDLSSILLGMGIEPLEQLRAGGRQTTEQDQELVISLCQRNPEGVCILVKAWEPPMLDFLDFVRGLRRQCGQKKPLIILLWGGENDVTMTDRETWQLTLGQLADPDLHIESIGQGK